MYMSCVLQMTSHLRETDFFHFYAFAYLQDTIIPRKGKDLDGELISVNMDTKKNAYVIEYTVTSKGVQRHLLTVFSLQPGRQLISLTGQAKADNWGAREAVIRAVADSYVLTPLD